MKEKPILFSGLMVRRILLGEKTQTRRVVKPQPSVVHAIHSDTSISTNLIFRIGDQRIHCPYGQPGDRLWVKETFQSGKGLNLLDTEGRITNAPAPRWIYRANGRWSIPPGTRWRPSIFMPHQVSRLTLEIVSVRVERLQDITEEDALAEGITELTKDGDVKKYAVLDRGDHSSTPWATMPSTARAAFRALWESIHDPGSWDANPWVWVVEFKKL